MVNLYRVRFVPDDGHVTDVVVHAECRADAIDMAVPEEYRRSHMWKWYRQLRAYRLPDEPSIVISGTF